MLHLGQKIEQYRVEAGEGRIIAAWNRPRGGKSGHQRAGWLLTVAWSDPEKVPQKVNRLE